MYLTTERLYAWILADDADVEEQISEDSTSNRRGSLFHAVFRVTSSGSCHNKFYIYISTATLRRFLSTKKKSLYFWKYLKLFLKELAATIIMNPEKNPQHNT